MSAVCASGHVERRPAPHPGRTVSTPRVAAGLIAVGLASPALGVVSANRDSLPRPDNGWIGRWNGSSAVPIGEHWFITAKHVGGLVNQTITIRGENYRAAEIVQHPSFDLMLVRTVEPMPGWHELADAEFIASGDPCIIAGFGATAGDELADGYSWNGPKVETWGANMLDSAGFLLAISFTNPSSPHALPHESTFAVNDSGGGLFVHDGEGNLRLAGVAVSVSGWGASRWGNAAYALNVSQLKNWIMPIIDPGRPVASSVQAPRSSMGWLIGAVVLPAIAARMLGRGRKRRVSC